MGKKRKAQTYHPHHNESTKRPKYDDDDKYKDLLSKKVDPKITPA